MWKGGKDAGQALVLVALAMVVILGFMGLGLDLGYMRYVKRRTQKLADAAAIAGARELHTGGSTSAVDTASTQALVENGIANASAYFDDSSRCNLAPPAGQTYLLTNSRSGPRCVSTDPHFGDTNYVEATIAQGVPTVFAKVFGIQSAVVSARAEAGLTNSSNCLYVLGMGNKTFNVSSTEVDFNHCTININSANANGLQCTNGPKVVTFQEVKYGAAHTAGSCFFTNSEVPKSPPAADPLAYLTPPAAPSGAGSCNATQCSPGTFASTLVISGGNVSFSPGLYYLQNGITISGSPTVTGTGVTFFVQGGSVTIDKNGTNTTGSVQLAAPTDKTNSLYGILFWQAAVNASAASFGGADSSYFSGTLYFPGADVTFGGQTLNYNKSAAYTLLVSDTVQFNTSTGNATFNAPPSGDSPVKIAAIGE